MSVASPSTRKKHQPKTQKTVPWNVVVLDDPVNLQTYVTMVFKRVFAYPHQRAEQLMMEVHSLGKSVVWTGDREKAEFYVQQLHGWQLQSKLEKAL